MIIPAIPEYAAETGVAALAQSVAALQEAAEELAAKQLLDLALSHFEL